jgi:hypothetical protein
MTRNPEFLLQHEDVRDWFVDVMISIVMVMLMRERR